jgi:hypothetical protein
MKKYLLLGLMATTLHSFSQETPEIRTFAIKANPLPFLIDNNSNESYYLFSTALRINAEKSIGKNKSLVFELGYAGPKTFDIENGEANESIQTTGIIAGFGNKFYLNNSSSMTGAYLMPMVNYSFIKLLEHPEGMPRNGYVGFKDLGLSGMIGYQSVFKNNWVIDMYSGAQLFQRNYFDNTYMESTAVINHNEIGLKPVLGLSIGKLF